MTGYKIVNLKLLLDEIGEDSTKGILSSFSCPRNQDVEKFLTQKAILFSIQNYSQTHLVFASYKKEWVLVGYYTLASKYITVSSKRVRSSTMRKRLAKFSTFDSTIESYCLSAPLIAQLGKNFVNGYNELITGNELLKLACDKVAKIQLEIGGRFTYVECEDKQPLIDFYSNNGFFEFDQRLLDRDETDFCGDYLVQMLKYIK